MANRWRSLSQLALGATLGLIACGAARTARAPYEKVRLFNPVQYSETWRKIERCTGMRMPMSRVKIYIGMVDSRGLMPSDGTSVVLAYVVDHRQEVVIGSPWQADLTVVGHEFAHVLGSPGYHDADVFQRKCKDLVMCVDVCLRDTIPPKRTPLQVAKR